MRIHLLRHADAEDHAATDAHRRLTEKGRGQAEQVAAFLRRSNQAIDLILTSPYARARETAEAVHREFPSAKLLSDPRIGCGMTPETAVQILREHVARAGILLVGHQPDLSELAAFLLSADRSLRVDFHKASLMTLEIGALKPGHALLQSLVLPRQMAQNAG